ncbi:MAG: CHAT domain-containing protein [Chloroflexota bacterium]
MNQKSTQLTRAKNVCTHNESIYEDFELLIGSGNDTIGEYTITVVESPAGEATEIMTLDPTNYEVEDMLAALAERDTDATFLTEFGTFLFEELFVGDIGKLYYASLNIVRAQEKRLRIRLNIKAPELAALPWEYLYDPEEELFLATASDTALVRYVSMRVSHRAKAAQISPPLRILVVVSNPVDLHQLNFEQEKELIEDALQEWVDQGRVEIQILEHAIISKINHAIRSFAPHVFHFVGHGLFEDDTAYVVLEDEDDHAHPVDERTFRNFFTSADETRLVVLNACQTATLSSSQPLVGLAPRLLQRRVPAVVAMQYPIADSASLVFAREFYRSIALGYSTEAAISEARRGMFMDVDGAELDWGVPVLFLRAKDGQLFELVEDEETQTALDIPPPPEPTTPPSTDGFIGRIQELGFYESRMAETNFAVIAGMAGVGKTMLAATLVKRLIAYSQDGVMPTYQPEKVFWHTFHQGEDVYALIWQLAGFLSWNGQPEIWLMLQSTQQSNAQLPPAEILINYLFQYLKGKNYLLCLDNFHYLYDNVQDDADLQLFVERLYDLVTEGEIAAMLITRLVPNFIHFRQAFKPLKGLNPSDVQTLLDKREVELGDDLFEHLYDTTQGNAQLLTIAIDTLKRVRDPEQFIRRLPNARTIEHYLLHEWDNSLNDLERKIQSGLAVLGIASTRDAIEVLIDQTNLRRVLYAMCDRFLIWRERYQELDVVNMAAQDLYRYEQRDYLEDRYNHHAIMRRFYYEQPSRRQRREMHLRAAEYYEYEEENIFQAAKHYFRGQKYDVAAELLVNREHSMMLVNRGLKNPLLDLLTDLIQYKLAPETKARMYIALGRFAPQDDLTSSTALLQNALDILQQLPPSEEIQLYEAETCLYLANRLHHGGQQQEAIACCERGLDALGEQVWPLKAELMLAYGRILTETGKFEAAAEIVQETERYIGHRSSALRLDHTILQAHLLFYQGKLIEQAQVMAGALFMADSLYNPFRKMTILNNLGLSTQATGQWNKAVARWQEGLKTASDLGHVHHQAMFMLNIGMIKLYQGHHDEALTLFTQSESIAKKNHLYFYQLAGLLNIAMTYLQKKHIDHAQVQLAEAEQLAHAIDATVNLPELYRLKSQTYLLEGQLEKAQSELNKALALSSSMRMKIEHGKNLRVQAAIFQTQKDYSAALDALHHSLIRVEDDMYEAALTKRLLGEVLMNVPDAYQQAEAYLNEAQATFVELAIAEKKQTTMDLGWERIFY